MWLALVMSWATEQDASYNCIHNGVPLAAFLYHVLFCFILFLCTYFTTIPKCGYWYSFRLQVKRKGFSSSLPFLYYKHVSSIHLDVIYFGCRAHIYLKYLCPECCMSVYCPRSMTLFLQAFLVLALQGSLTCPAQYTK